MKKARKRLVGVIFKEETAWLTTMYSFMDNCKFERQISAMRVFRVALTTNVDKYIDKCLQLLIGLVLSPFLFSPRPQ